MFWYETQYRHAEEARQRNKREERKLKLEIERKNGMRAVLRYQTDSVSKEQRRIKRELEKMRKSSIGPTNVFNRSNHTLQFRNRKAFKRKIARVDAFNFFEKEYMQNDHVTESELMRSIMLINCESNGKENNEMFKKGQFNDLTTRSESSEQQHSLSSYEMTDMISTNNNNSGSIQCGVQNTVDRQSQNNQSSNDNKVSNRLSPLQLSTSPQHISLELREEQDVITDLRSEIVTDGDSVSTGSSFSSKRRNKSLELSELANLDMKSVKSDVSRRLSGTTGPSKSDLERRRVSDGSVALPKPLSKLPPSRRRTSDGQVQASKISTPSPDKSEASNAKPEEASMEASAVVEDVSNPVSSKRTTKSNKDIIPTPLNYNPEYQNPDGSLRTKWTLPDPDQAWEAARKARYIRTKDTREMETELSVNDIFK